MDTTDPAIVFAGDGTCNHCAGALRRLQLEQLPLSERPAVLGRIVRRLKDEGRGKDYDCIIGVSGGVDSTMVAHLTHQFGLRALAVHFDNGWDSELAVDNIKNTIEWLGIDLYTHVVDWEEFRDLQIAFLRASISNAEIPSDHGIHALLFRVAAREHVRFILSGSNLATEGMHVPVSWSYYHQDLRLLKAIQRRFGTVPLRTFPQISIRGYLANVFIRGIRQVPILNYVDYRKADAMALIQRDLGWRPYGGKHYESVYTRFYQGYILPTKFRWDKRRVHLSSLICSGNITRDQALVELERDPYAGSCLAIDKEFVIKKLGLTPEGFEAIMALPIRTYRDYPNNVRFFHDSPRLKAVFKRVATRP
jgi:N-acetyl sugar amidotransferase